MMKETIAVIGAAGRLGSTLARRLARGGRSLLLHDLDAQRLEELIGTITNETPEADVEAVATARDAGWEADVVIPAVPYEAQIAVACEIRQVVTRKIVVSVANPLTERLDALVTPTSAAEELAHVLCHSRVVKAFNTVSAADILHPAVHGVPFDCFIAGDDEDALRTVSRLVTDVGLNPVVVGTLAASRILEGMTLLLMRLARQRGWSERAGWKILASASVHGESNRHLNPEPT